VASPDLAHQLVTRHHDHGTMSRNTIPAQGNGITVQHGAEWRRSRMLMQPMFGRPVLRKLVAKMVEAIDARLGRLDELAASGEPFDMAKFLGEITIRVLFHAMFSDEYSDDEIDFAIRQLDEISVYKGELMTKDWRPPGPLAHEESGQAAVAALDSLLYASIERRRAAIAAGEAPADDLLGRILAAVDEDGNGFSDQEVRDQLTVLFFGGYETTQWAMAWALSFLPSYPAVMDRLLSEVDGLGGRVPTAEDLGALEYTKAVVNEALRHQGTLVLPRELEEADVFAGYELPAGTLVGAAVSVIHHRPDLWDDPATFRPERFLGLEADAQHKYQMLSFGGGPRQCLGINLAYYEAQLTLAMFLQRYTYEIEPGWERRGVHQYSVVLAGGLPVRVQRRSAAGGAAGGASAADGSGS
jgi:cytochrome P450